MSEWRRQERERETRDELNIELSGKTHLLSFFFVAEPVDVQMHFVCTLIEMWFRKKGKGNTFVLDEHNKPPAVTLGREFRHELICFQIKRMYMFNLRARISFISLYNCGQLGVFFLQFWFFTPYFFFPKHRLFATRLLFISKCVIYREKNEQMKALNKQNFTSLNA